MSLAPTPDHAFIYSSEPDSGIPIAMGMTNTGTLAPIGLRLDSEFGLPTWISGAMASGKTTLLDTMFSAAVQQAMAIVFIRPIGQLDEVLNRIPPHRQGDVLILDGTEQRLDAPAQIAEISDSITRGGIVVCGNDITSSHLSSSILTALTRKHLPGDPLKPCLLLIDEAQIMQNIFSIETLAQLQANNVHVVLAAQTPAQFPEEHGYSHRMALTSNRVVMTPNPYARAWYEEHYGLTADDLALVRHQDVLVSIADSPFFKARMLPEFLDRNSPVLSVGEPF